VLKWRYHGPEGKGALPALDSRDDFLSYASQYWVTHARRAQPFGAFQSSSLHDLLHDHELLENWTRAYASHSRLFIHYGRQESAGPIAIFAEHGLEVALQEALSAVEDSWLFPGDIGAALIVATATEQGDIINRLLNGRDYDSAIIEKAIVTALGGYEIHEHILNSPFERSLSCAARDTDISALMRQAAQRGLPDIVRRLIDSGYAQNNTQHQIASNPLQAAIIAGDSGRVLEVLEETDVLPIDLSKPFLLHGSTGTASSRYH
jgi:hypothetical protein